ncbi:uncharacterized protein V1516DRAFT_673031 [Lipomyces oligophaga]|uniref:uncharacterized protein n=1 Tax=Lipomyces oligophaga TaxID=45792 RepID=UPI0034CE2330
MASEDKIAEDQKYVLAMKTVSSSIESVNQRIKTLLDSSDLAQLGKDSAGVSLMGLKDETMTSYLHDLVLRCLISLASSDQELIEEESSANETLDQGPKSLDEFDDEVRKLIVTDRVILERGVRPLEKKIEYQIQKLLRAADAPIKTSKFAKKIDYNSDEDESALSDEQTSGNAFGEDEEENEDEEEDEEDDLPLSYKPRPNMLVNSTSSRTKQSKESSKPAKYIPPKINPTKLPSTRNTSGQQSAKLVNKLRKNTALEEYITETTSTAPESAPSVGANVLAHGRGGTQTTRDLAQESRIRGYEEMNFIRLAENKSKRKKPNQNEFMGEDWDLGSGDYSAARRKKRSIWDRNR